MTNVVPIGNVAPDAGAHVTGLAVADNGDVWLATTNYGNGPSGAIRVEDPHPEERDGDPGDDVGAEDGAASVSRVTARLSYSAGRARRR